MLCERCKKNQATMRLTRTVNNKKTVMNLCSECAREVGAPISAAMDGFGSILSGLMGLETMWKATPDHTRVVKKCPSCGMTKEEISRSGKLGCSECYITFLDDMRPLLRKIHGNCVHRGSTPGTQATPIEKKCEDQCTGKMVTPEENPVEILRVQMQEAIRKEDFEKAAELRDKIKELTEKEGQ